MLDNLTDNDLAILTELTIHHGMFNNKKATPRFSFYYRIAGELIEELERREYKGQNITLLKKEFFHSQMYKGDDEQEQMREDEI